MPDDDEPIYRHTNLGGGYTLVEENGLCIIEPDPMEEMIDRYLASQEPEEYEFWQQIDKKVCWLSMPGHDEPQYCGERLVKIEHRGKAHLTGIHISTITVRCYVIGWTEYEGWVEWRCIL